MDIVLNVRIPDSLAARLAEHKQRNSTNISAFVRRAIERALEQPVVDAEPPKEQPDGIS
jgi:predicted DNA-binding protein